jgi:polar amino acid transport system permease protein
MNFAAKFDVFWELFIQEGGWKRVLSVGLVNTLLIAVLGLLIGIILGTLIAAVKVMPKYKLLPKILDKICTVYVGFFRGTPIVVQLLIGYYVIWPLMGITVSPLNTSIIIFGLNSAAYVSEIMRGGILSVDPGQMEAGRALGLSFFTTMIKIVIPQAIKNILPTLGNEFIALIKDTSVVSFVAATDLYKTFTEIGNVRYEYFMPYLAMAIMYMILVFIISCGIKAMERSLRKSDKN